MKVQGNNQVFVNARFLTQRISGVQRYAIELSKALKKKWPGIRFIAPNNIIHTELADLLEVQIIGKTKNGVLWEQIELPMFLKKEGKPLLINLGNVAPLLYDNNIITVYDLSFHLHPEWFSKKFTIFYNFLIPLIVKKSRHIITCSYNSKKDICKYFGANQDMVDVIYPGVSKYFLNNDLFEVDVANKYGNYILAVSSLDPRKNFKRLIKAYKKCYLTETKLIIVGSANKLFAKDNELKNIMKDDSSIIFTGYVSDKELFVLYKHAKVFAYPSLFEGFGLPPLEAMACGCVTVVANTTSLPEVCGKASIYVNPYDIDSIKEGLLEGLNNDARRKEMIKLGYQRVLNYNFENSVNAVVKLIKSILA